MSGFEQNDMRAEVARIVTAALAAGRDLIFEHENTELMIGVGFGNEPLVRQFDTRNPDLNGLRELRRAVEA